MPLNPYEPPRSTCVEAADVLCSFCGRPGREVGSLAQSPSGHSYICQGCTQIAGELHATARKPLAYRAAAATLGGGLTLMLMAVSAWDALLSDEPQVTRWITVPMLVVLCGWLVVSSQGVLRGRW